MTIGVSTVAQLIVQSNINLKCKGCGRAIQVTINDDCYIYLPNGGIRFQCPKCGHEYEINFDIKEVKKGDK